MGRDARLNRLQQQANPVVRDRYGRELQAGDEIDIEHRPTGGILIESITPSMHPNHPPGTVLVRAVASYQFAVNRQPQPQFLLVRSREELIAAGVLRETTAEEAGPGQVAVPVEQEEERPVAPPVTGPKLVALTDLPDPRD